jgi:flavin reductase (DIM6/NTAB) family NADH-FMN oxidoreductase RutF
MHLTPGKAAIVQAPIIEEAPLSIECRVKEIVPLGSHEMYIAEVVNVIADDRYINPDTGKFELADSDPLVYLHGGYYHLGNKIGKFGWSVEKKKKRTDKTNK